MSQKRWQLHNINEIMNTVVTGWKPFPIPGCSPDMADKGLGTGHFRQRTARNEGGFVELSEEECRQLELPKEWIA